MIAVGLDIGSVATKAVLINGQTQERVVVPTGWSPRSAGEGAIKHVLAQSGIDRKQVNAIIATGYGRISFAGADRTVTEIKCHARGIAQLYTGARTIIDIGGQDSKVIHIDGSGKVRDFAMNDKCAAGTGRFLQVMAAAMGVDVSQLGDLEESASQVNINSMCTVFAESEIIGLLARGSSKGGIIAGLHQSVARRVAAMVRRLGIREQVVFTGGVAMNRGVQRAMQEELGCAITVPETCQFTGALGAALLACEEGKGELIGR